MISARSAVLGLCALVVASGVEATSSLWSANADRRLS